MKFKKKGLILALALSLTLIVTSVSASLPNFADLSEEGLPADITNQLKGHAVVKAPLHDNQLLVTVNEMDIVLNISDETLVIDSKTGLPATLSDLEAGDLIFVYYSAMMTKSMPPQSHAIAIVTQVEENKNHAEFFTVREILSRNDGEVRALNKEGNLIVTFIEERSLSPFKTKQTVNLDSIQVGSQLFIWYEIVALSYPGQTGATKAVFVGQEEATGVRAVYTPMAGLETAQVTIDNQDIQLKDHKMLSRKGLLMLPLRAVAEGLGYSVTWTGEQERIDLDNGTIKETLYIGKDPDQLGIAPILIDGTSYVPAAFFNLLYNDNNAVKIN